MGSCIRLWDRGGVEKDAWKAHAPSIGVLDDRSEVLVVPRDDEPRLRSRPLEESRVVRACESYFSDMNHVDASGAELLERARIHMLVEEEREVGLIRLPPHAPRAAA